MRAIRIYELDITYPEGQDGSEYDEVDGLDPDGYDIPYTRARWPQERRFLSRSGAFQRAHLLTQRGCAVDVRQSEPIAWESDPVAHFDALPPAEPEPEPAPPPWTDPNWKPF